jgi:hypothetical protein
MLRFGGKKTMKTFRFRSAGLLGLLSLSIAHGAILFDSGTTALTAGDPTQLGRLSRNGLPQDWASDEAFPGIINATTTYHYTTFLIAPPSYYPYLQITIDSLSANTFASAYLNLYDPTNLATNWLGDAGSSGNFFGTDPIAFQVIVPAGDSLVVVVNNTAAGSVGIGDPFDILVEGFTDTLFDDTVPEPASIFLGGSGLGVGLLTLFLRRRIRVG